MRRPAIREVAHHQRVPAAKSHARSQYAQHRTRSDGFAPDLPRQKSVFCRSKVNGHVIAAERLEETLQICVQMWSDDDSPYVGKHYRLERTLNSPQALSRPHAPVLIGGAGERKTLRLVAQ